ncbi:MAG: aminotransferase class IV, partial [Planctomycetota bacterium]
ALATVPWRRDPRSPTYGHKTLNYYENMLARWDARKRGAIDALLLGTNGEVLEGSASNIFLVKRGRLVTPALGAGILPGVTREVVLKLARIPCAQRTVRVQELLNADEVFITNALIEVVPIVKVDRRRIGPPGPVTRELAVSYKKKVERECPAR